MKNLIPHTLCLTTLLCLSVGCGKAPETVEDDKPASTHITETAPVADDKTFEDIHAFIAQDRLDDLTRTMESNPEINLNKTKISGESPLITAIKNDSKNVRDHLIKNGASLEEMDPNGDSPMFVAVEMNQEDTVQILIDKKVKLDTKNRAGNTILHLAIKKGFDKIAVLLIKSGANYDITDGDNFNAESLADQYSLKGVLELILGLKQAKYGLPNDATFRKVISAGNIEALQILMIKSPVPNSINPVGLAVDIVSEMVSVQILQILIKNKADVNGPAGDLAPLIRTAMAQKTSRMTILLNAKAKIEATDAKGKTALIHAVQNNNLEMVELLLNRKAKIDYSVKVLGEKYSYDACDVARAVGKKLSDKDTKKTNDTIKDRLDCGFWDWLF